MKRLVILAALVLGASDVSAEQPVELRTCFFDHEEDGGTNKLCFYDCGGSTAVISIKAYKVCPVTIQQ